MKYNINWLIGQYNENQPLQYLFFWGHQPSKDGSITQSCFSQWWLSSFEDESKTFKTAEHWMMYQKAMLFNNAAIAENILETQSPAEVKKLGRMITGFDAALWDAHKFDIVVKGNYHKFSQNKSLKDYLINTGNSILTEASPVDNIWGIGMAVNDVNIENPLLWKGENLLGFALMEVRDTLINEL